MSNEKSRRAFLGAAATAATTALAGCLGGGEQPPLYPRVPERALEEDGWEQVDSFDERVRDSVEIGLVEPSVEFHARGDVYANKRPIERVAQRFNVDEPPFQPPPAQFTPTKVETDPPLHRLAGLSNSLNERLLDQIENRAIDRLRDDGLRRVRRIEEGNLNIRAAGEANHRRYRAEFAYERDQTEINGQPVTIEPGTFEVEAQLAVWTHGGLLVTAGGAYPGEPGTIELTVNGQTQEVDLRLQPRQYRRSVRTLITLVS